MKGVAACSPRKIRPISRIAAEAEPCGLDIQQDEPAMVGTGRQGEASRASRDIRSFPLTDSGGLPVLGGAKKGAFSSKKSPRTTTTSDRFQPKFATPNRMIVGIRG
jgi:hypothetical protein